MNVEDRLRNELDALSVDHDDDRARAMAAIATDSPPATRWFVPAAAAASIVAMASLAAGLALTAGGSHGPGGDQPAGGTSPSVSSPPATPSVAPSGYLDLTCVGPHGSPVRSVRLKLQSDPSAHPGNFERVYLPQADGSVCTPDGK